MHLLFFIALVPKIKLFLPVISFVIHDDWVAERDGGNLTMCSVRCSVWTGLMHVVVKVVIILSVLKH
jgi:hypothetical protein